MNSHNIRPFRSVIRGYTGQIKNAALREHLQFELKDSEKHLQNLEPFLLDIHHADPDQITQVLRGQHYIWVDFLLTRKLASQEEMEHIFLYFSKHITLNLLYITEMLKKDTNAWFESSEEATKAFADAHFEIFDSTFSIIEGYLRNKDFHISNSHLIR